MLVWGRVNMSEVWGRGIEARLRLIEERLIHLEGQNATLIRYVVVGLMAIVGSIVGVNVFA